MDPRILNIPCSVMATEPNSLVVPVTETENVEIISGDGLRLRRGSEIKALLPDNIFPSLGPTYVVIMPVAPDAEDGTELGMIVRTDGDGPRIVKMEKYFNKFEKRDLADPPILEFTINDCTGGLFAKDPVPGGGGGIFVSRFGNAQGPASVNFRGQNGTLVNGVDFVLTAGSLSWAVGDVADKTIFYTTDALCPEGYFDIILEDALQAYVGEQYAFRIYVSPSVPDPELENPPRGPLGGFLVAPFTFDATARFHSIVQANSGLYFYSSKNRGIVWSMGLFWEEGMLPPLTAGVLSTAGSGYSMQGTWKAVWCYYDVRTRLFSDPSPESNTITITGDQGLVFTPPGAGTLPIRDTAYFPNGSTTPRATNWFIFLNNTLTGDFYQVGFPGVSSGGAYTIQNTITAANLPVNRRALPRDPSNVYAVQPSFGLATFDGSRIWKCGQEGLNIPITLTLVQGSGAITLSSAGWEAKHLGYELVVDNLSTGFVISSIVSTTVANIVGPDLQTTWIYGNRTLTAGLWSLAPRPNVLIGSSYGATGVNGIAEVNLEGFPVTLTIEGELDPSDANGLNGVVATPDGLTVTRSNSIHRVSNSGVLNEVFFQSVVVAPISRGMGCMCPNTLCKDQSGIVYMLGPNGPVRVIGGQVQSILAPTNYNIFPQVLVFDEDDRPTADLDIKTGIYLISNVQRLSEFGTDSYRMALALDVRNGGMTLMQYPSDLTGLRFISPYNAQIQGVMLAGDRRGYLIQLFTPGLTADDYIAPTNYLFGNEGIPTPVIYNGTILFSPVGNPVGTVAQGYWLPRFDVQGDLTEPVAILETEAKGRGTDPLSFTAQSTETISLNPPIPRVGLLPLSGETLQFRVKMNSGSSSARRISMQSLNVIVYDFMGG